jgi:hypothetical protein
VSEPRGGVRTPSGRKRPGGPGVRTPSGRKRPADPGFEPRAVGNVRRTRGSNPERPGFEPRGVASREFYVRRSAAVSGSEPREVGNVRRTWGCNFRDFTFYTDVEAFNDLEFVNFFEMASSFRSNVFEAALTSRLFTFSKLLEARASLVGVGVGGGFEPRRALRSPTRRRGPSPGAERARVTPPPSVEARTSA